MSLGENIKDLRKKNNLSQGQLAKMLFVTPQAVSRWESNDTEPDSKTLVKLAAIFNVTLDQLVIGDEFTNRVTKYKKIYHAICLYGGIFTTIFAICYTPLIVKFSYSLLVWLIYLFVTLSFLVNVLIFSIKSRKLKEEFDKRNQEIRDSLNKYI